MLRLFRTIPKPHAAARRGVTAVEFALIAPVFFLMLSGVIELSLMLLTQHLMENTMFNASRTAKTGYAADGKTQLDTVIQSVNTELGSLYPLVDVSKATFQYTSYGDLSQIGQPEQGVKSLGTPQQVVVFTLSYPWKFFTPFVADIIGDAAGQMTLTSRIVVRNEPYDN